jgi:hypothetical protein
MLEKNVVFPIKASVQVPCDLYIDIEGEATRPLEVTMIAACGITVINYLHVYGTPTKEDWGAAKYCHGIFRPAPVSLSKSSLQFTIKAFLHSLPGVNQILANGIKDIVEFFSDFLQYQVKSGSIQDINYPAWDARIMLPSHQLVALFKEKEIPPPPLKCACKIHLIHSYYNPGAKQKNNTFNQLVRKMARSHCSLYDAMEVFYYVNEIGSIRL